MKNSETGPIGILVEQKKISKRFHFRTIRDDRIQLYFNQKLVTTLSSGEGVRFLSKIEGASDDQAQLLMAKATKNFKRGNERPP